MSPPHSYGVNRNDVQIDVSKSEPDNQELRMLEQVGPSWPMVMEKNVMNDQES
ncbi:MAG: hypothetical protein LV473_20950 [Nitrospira sp.]|nr:hypothetical protein [Nitrospira sp.]